MYQRKKCEHGKRKSRFKNYVRIIEKNIVVKIVAVMEFANINKEKNDAKIAVEMNYANIIKKNIIVKIVEEVKYVNMIEENLHVKIVAEVQGVKNIIELKIGVKIVLLKLI